VRCSDSRSMASTTCASNSYASNSFRASCRRVLGGPSLLPWAVVCLASALPWEHPPPMVACVSSSFFRALLRRDRK
jgi:hypothetical protein